MVEDADEEPDPSDSVGTDATSVDSDATTETEASDPDPAETSDSEPSSGASNETGAAPNDDTDSTADEDDAPTESTSGDDSAEDGDGAATPDGVSTDPVGPAQELAEAVSADEEGDPDDATENQTGPPTPSTVPETTAEEIEAAAEEGATPRGPSSDQEMPLEAHIEEMIRRLATVILAAAIVSAIMLPFGDSMITFLWDSVLIGTDARPHLYSPPELIITQIKVASLAGLVVALPVLVYQSYRFMRPGLYPHERRYYLAAVPTSLVLAFVGLTFAYFVVLPAVFTYFLRYSEETATIAFGLAPTFNLILILLGYLAVVFQIPLFVMLAMMMGLVTRQWLIRRRLLFWGAFAGISFLFSPDPTGVSPLIIAVTMIVLFEGTLFLARWTKSGQRVA